MEISKDLLEYARGISEKIIFFAIKVVLFITIVKFILAHPYQISYYVNNFSIVRLILAIAIILKIPKSIVFKICAILLLFWLEQWNTYIGFEDVTNKVMLLPKLEQPNYFEKRKFIELCHSWRSMEAETGRNTGGSKTKSVHSIWKHYSFTPISYVRGNRNQTLSNHINLHPKLLCFTIQH